MDELSTDCIMQAIDRTVQLDPNLNAIADAHLCLSNSELWAESTRVRNALLRQQVDPSNDTLAVVARHSIAAIPIMLGALLTGAHVELIDAEQPVAIRQAMLRHAPADCAVGLGDDLAALGASPTELRDTPPLLEGTALLRMSGGSRRPVPATPGTVTFFTSGTTGAPKGVVHDQRSLIFGIWSTLALQARGLGLHLPRPDSMAELERAITLLNEASRSLAPVFSSMMALTTIAGFTVLMRSLIASQFRFVVNGPFDADNMLDLIESHRITNLAVSPFGAQALMRAQSRRPRNTDSLLALGVGAGPSPPTLRLALEDTFACIALVGYGTTETGGLVTMCDPADAPEARSSTVGRAAPGVALTLCGAAGEPVAQGGCGELVVSTDAVMLGYVDDPAVYGAERRVGRGEFHTGDLASISDDGQVKLQGRISEMIIRGGENIDPVAIEQVLESHPAVRAACVIGVPSRVGGEQDIVAVLEPAPAGHVNSLEIRRYCAERLGSRRTPSKISVGVLPRTNDGSVRRGSVGT